MSYQLANGVTVREVWGGNSNYTEYIGSDGKTYPSIEAANRASDLFNASSKAAAESANLSVQQQRLDLQAQKNAMENQAATTQMTNEFLSKWGDMNTKALDMLQSAISGESGGGAFGGGATTNAFNNVISNIQGQLDQYDADFGGMSKEAYGIAMSDLRNKGEMTRDLMADAETNYAGVEGRAATDVAGQAARARQGMAMEAMSYGVDPTSGKFGALQKKSFLNEARGKVEAMNKARVAEKERSTGLKMDLMKSIDPTVAANIGSNLQSKKAELLGLQTSAADALSNAETARMNAITNMAGLVTDIGSQYGSLGSTMLGLQTGQGTYGNANTKNTTKTVKTTT